MAVVKNLMVRAGADFSALIKQANTVKASMSGMQSSVSKSCSKISASVGGMKKAFAALATVVSMATIISVSKEAKAAYDRQAESEAKLARVMRNTIRATNDEIASIKALCSAQQELGVIGDEVQLAGAQELATYVTMTSTLETLIPTMNDMVAQQYGLAASAENAASIATMLGKVMNGQTSALSRYGYSFTAAQEAVLKYGTEAQRAAVLAEVVGESVGGMNAALAATPSGRLQQVSNTLGDIKENFGQAVTTGLTAFLPMLITICNVLASMATLANKVAQAIANVFGGGARPAAVVSYAGAAASGMEDIADKAAAAGKAVKSLGTYGFDTLQQMSGTSSSGGVSGGSADAGAAASGGMITETAAGAEEAGESIGWLESALARLKATADSLSFAELTGAFDRLKTAVEPLTQSFFSGLTWAYDNIFEPLAHWTVESALPDFLDMLANSASACSPALDKLGNAVAPLASSAFEGLKWAYDNVFIPLGTWAGGEYLPAFLDLLSSAANALSAALEAVQPFANWLWTNFLEPIAAWTGGAIVTQLETMAGLLDLLADTISGDISVWEALGEAAGLVVDGILTVLEPVTDWIETNVVEPVKNAWDDAMSKLQEWASDAWTGIQNAWSAAKGWFTSNVADPIKNTWNDATSKLKEWASDAWTGIQNAWSAAEGWFTSNVAEPIKNTWSDATSRLKEWAGDAWTGIQNAWSVAEGWFTSNVADPIKDTWSGATSRLKELGRDAWAGIQNVWSAADPWFDETIATPVSETFSAATIAIGGFFSDAWTQAQSAWSAAESWFTTNVTTPIADGFREFANGIIGSFEGLVNGAISGANKIIGAFNAISFDTPDWVPVIGGKSFGFDLPTMSTISLPRLANGAVFQGNDPYLAVVNDQKHGVNVETPLATMIEAMMTALRSVDLLGDIQVDVRAVFDGQLAALARLLRPYFEADAKRVGNRASTSKGAI